MGLDRAENQVLGRVAAKAAQILKGKHKPQYTPHVDTGDFVVIINADKIRVTGHEGSDEELLPPQRFPGRPEVRDLRRGHGQASRARHRARREGHVAEEHARAQLAKKLKVYTGAEHPHMAQQPREIKMEG